MVTDTAYYHALEDIALLEAQRDQLREALVRMVEDSEDINAVYSDLHEATDEARAALKATEEG